MRLASAPAEGSPRAVFFTLVGIATAAGLAIALVFELTATRVDDAHARLRSDAVRAVLPGAVRWVAYAEGADDTLSRIDDGARGAVLFAGYDADDRLVGYAVPAQGLGYQDRIGLLIGLDVAAGELLGLRVLESRETPGLGARIADDPVFLAAFRGRPVHLNADGSVRTADDIDVISGATVSSQAVVRIVGESLEHWWPRLRAREAGDG